MRTRIVAVAEHVRGLLSPRRSSTRIAVVGASAQPHKFGYVIVRDLAEKGFSVSPINPRVARGGSAPSLIAGLPAHPDLLSIEASIDLAVFVVPPAVTFDVLRQLAGLSDVALWLQPGAFDSNVLAFARHVFEHVVAGRCIMLDTR